MTTENAFIFAWDMHGIESIIPITEYENISKVNTMNVLSNKPLVKDPLNRIIRTLMLRARLNPHRFYEIYAIDCAEEMDLAYWTKQWKDHPQFCAELIRERGQQLHSDRNVVSNIVIT